MTPRDKKKLDRLWQQVIHSRSESCEVCGKYGALNGHHIFSRSRMNTRWDTDNGILLCTGCHTFSSLLSAHKAPRAFLRWLEDDRGKEWLDNLETRSNMIAKGLDFQLIKLLLEQELNN